MIPILIVLTILQFIPENYFQKKDFRWQVDNSQNRRMANRYSYSLSNVHSLKDIIIFGAYKYFEKKFEDFYTFYNNGIRTINNQRFISNIFTNTLDILVKICGYVVVFVSFITHQIAIGTVYFRIQSLNTFINNISNLLHEMSRTNDHIIKMTDVVNFLNLKPAFEDGTKTLVKLKEAPEIEFKGVTFAYPNSDKNIINNFNLKIKKGEKIAIVGENGAGKSTLVKLISKIYVPQTGSILVNGIPLVNIKTSEWHKNLGVLFQDFAFFSHMTAKENIFIGDTSHPEVIENEVIEASKKADSHEFIMEYAKQYDQILDESFEGGVRPSGGQRQKIAIARFFYRNSPFVIFDEPTSSISALSEDKIFRQIYKFFKNKTVITISHKFSTVRSADRIIVLDKGQIIEEGTHETLLEKNGVYANSFKVQAKGYST